MVWCPGYHFVRFTNKLKYGRFPTGSGGYSEVRRIDPASFVRATRSTPRDINRRILLSLVREHQPVSRADLARLMGIGRGRVTELVTNLVADGELQVGSTTALPRGRRPEMLSVRTGDRLVMAIDVRFSRTFLMLSDFSGRSIAADSFETMIDPSALIGAIAKRVKGLLRKHDRFNRCEGIGLVVPGMVDQNSGRVLNSPQLGWKNIEIREALSRAVHLPVEIENAPIACALARMWLGERGVRVPRNFVYVTVSDGVGAGIVANGELVRGNSNTAGEFGHIPIELDGATCLCGARGCLETRTSNIATICRYLGVPFSAEAARELLIASGITITDVVARANAGENSAVGAVRETGRYLGAGISSIINALNPEMIFIGGEITGAWGIIGPEIREAIASRALSADAGETQLVIDSADSYPRLRGATALVSAKGFAAPSFG
jgi:N-acetylglucosamine repressor